jgi:hypothetical protein
VASARSPEAAWGGEGKRKAEERGGAMLQWRERESFYGFYQSEANRPIAKEEAFFCLWSWCRRFPFFFFFLRFLIIDPRKLGGHLFGIFLRIVSFSPAVSFLLLFKRSRVSTCSLDMNGLVESIENIFGYAKFIFSFEEIGAVECLSLSNMDSARSRLKCICKFKFLVSRIATTLAHKYSTNTA